MIYDEDFHVKKKTPVGIYLINVYCEMNFHEIVSTHQTISLKLTTKLNFEKHLQEQLGSI